MSEPVLKSHKWWLLCRIYAPVGIAAPFVVGFLTFDEAGWFGYALFALPLAVVALTMLYTAKAFRVDYSCFGRYERVPWPAQKPLLVEETSFGRVGLAIGRTASPWKWSLFASGLGIRIPYCGRAFIPLDAIQEVRRPSWGFRATLIHNSPELRNPISIPSNDIVEAIRQLIAGRQTQSASHGQVNSVI
jgi:hypothetical protein